MIPYISCPICKSKFRRISHNQYWWEEMCTNPSGIDYCQYYSSSFEDQELSYFNFYTKRFSIYSYCSGYHDKDYIGKTYVYYRKFPRGQPTQHPMIIFNNFIIDFDNLEGLDTKLGKLSLFT